MNTDDREYVYQARWIKSVVSIAIFSFGTFAGAYTALTNHKGAVIRGIEFSPAEATLIAWATCALCFGMAVLTVLSLIMRHLNPQKLILAADGLHAPRSMWSEEPTLIRYADIRSITTRKGKSDGEKILTMEHTLGKQKITAAKLPSKALFEEFRQELERRWQAAGGPPAV